MKEKLISTINDIRFYFVVVSLGALTLTIKYNNLKSDYSKEKQSYLRHNQLIDSLNSEIFVKDIQIGSYEVMWGILEEVNRPLADSINLLVE
jgi:hypothetical protein